MESNNLLQNNAPLLTEDWSKLEMKVIRVKGSTFGSSPLGGSDCSNLSGTCSLPPL